MCRKTQGGGLIGWGVKFQEGLISSKIVIFVMCGTHGFQKYMVCGEYCVRAAKLGGGAYRGGGLICEN